MSERNEERREPLTRDVREIVRALAIAEGEFYFQRDRLRDHAKARTEQEKSFHKDLMEGYRTGAHYAGVLRKYHEGRLRRQAETGSMAPTSVDEPEAIVDGRATAFLGDPEE